MKTSTIFGAVIALVVVAGLAACRSGTDAQSGGPAVPYKLGAFERSGQAFLGLVLKDTQIVDIGQANAAFEASNASAPRLTVPSDMKALIAGYDAQWKDRLSPKLKTWLDRLDR